MPAKPLITQAQAVPGPDPAAEPLLANIARHLAVQWNAPMAAIVTRHDDRATIAASIGLSDEARALALAEAARLCTDQSMGGARSVQAHGIAFLAAAPLTDAHGQRIGALVVLDRRARTASRRNVQALSDLATVVSLSLMMHQSLENLELLAITDPLTGLYNRRGLDLLFAEHQGHPMALLAVDIDDFKAVNDSLGHSAGDALLKQIATVLRQSVRISDIVARTGGDEFLILLPDTADAGIATQIAERIHHAFDASTVSIGIAHTRTPETLALLKAAADANLRTAKQSGKARTIAG